MSTTLSTVPPTHSTSTSPASSPAASPAPGFPARASRGRTSLASHPLGTHELSILVRRIAADPRRWRPAVRFGAAERYWTRLDGPEGVGIRLGIEQAIRGHSAGGHPRQQVRVLGGQVILEDLDHHLGIPARPECVVVVTCSL